MSGDGVDERTTGTDSGSTSGGNDYRSEYPPPNVSFTALLTISSLSVSDSSAPR